MAGKAHQYTRRWGGIVSKSMAVLLLVALVAIVTIWATFQPWSDPGAASRLITW